MSSIIVRVLIGETQEELESGQCDDGNRKTGQRGGDFTIAGTWKQPKCSSTDEWIKKMRYREKMAEE